MVTSRTLARKWRADFNQYAEHAHNKATSDAHMLKRLLHHAAPEAVQTAQKMGLLDTFPFSVGGNVAAFEVMDAKADDLAVELYAALSKQHNVLDTFGLWKFFAQCLLRSEHKMFADLLSEAAYLAQGDEQARDDGPMMHSLFEMYLEHSGRADELKADGLIISDVLTDSDPDERTAAFLAPCFEEVFVRLVDEKRDRLAVVNWTLPRYKRPDITEEEVKEDHTLGLVLTHWERAHGPIRAELEAEKAQLEAWLATEHLDLMYWWARDIQDGLSDCDWAKPSIALVLDYWKQEGVARDDITVDALFDALFPDDNNE